MSGYEKSTPQSFDVDPPFPIDFDPAVLETDRTSKELAAFLQDELEMYSEEAAVEHEHYYGHDGVAEHVQRYGDAPKS